MELSELKALPEMTHKTLREFLPVRLVHALMYAIFSITLGFMSAMVYFADLGPFFGIGYLSILCVIGLPLGIIALLIPMTMPRQASGRWIRFILLLSLLGTVLSLVGAINVVSTMFSLV